MSYTGAIAVAKIVRDAGGRVVGRTRLQKIAYLLKVTGLEPAFVFAYRHYGPFSQELADSVTDAGLLSLLTEREQQAAWGGTYSIFSVIDQQILAGEAPPARRALAELSADADAVELELAATAVYLALEGHEDPWAETARRKPEKADEDRLLRARVLYERLRQIETPTELPDLG